MPVGCGDLFDFLWRECHARPTDAICRDLARMSSIKWASVPPEGNRDPTNFRRVISRYRGGATHFYALLSRVRAPHVQYWSPQLSRDCKPASSTKSKPTESSLPQIWTHLNAPPISIILKSNVEPSRRAIEVQLMGSYGADAGRLRRFVRSFFLLIFFIVQIGFEKQIVMCQFIWLCVKRCSVLFAFFIILSSGSEVESEKCILFLGRHLTTWKIAPGGAPVEVREFMVD